MANNFFYVEVTDAQRVEAWNTAHRIIASLPIPDRSSERIRYETEQSYVGLLGEYCFADVMGISRKPFTGESDGGVDFEMSGKRIDVKTQLRVGLCDPRYDVNLAEVVARKYNPDVYLFLSYSKDRRVMEFLGWETKLAMTTRGKYRVEGEKIIRADGSEMTVSRAMYTLPVDDLRVFFDLVFREELENL